MGRPRKASAATGASPSSPAVRTSLPDVKSTASRPPASSSVSKPHAAAPTGRRGGADRPAAIPKGKGAVPPPSRSDAGDFRPSQEKQSSMAARSRAANASRSSTAASHNAVKEPNTKASGPASYQLGKEAVVKIEQETRGQRNNPMWHEQRENRITASIAHKIANSKFVNDRSPEVPQSYLKAVVNEGPKVQTPAMSWGVKNEKTAIKEYQQLTSRKAGKDVKVTDCGLFVHPEKSWLAASPDGIVRDGSTGKPAKLLEVKCPYKHRDHTVKDACKDKTFCLEEAGDAYALKKDHAYYSQVQCQLAATGLTKADFVVHTKKETVITPVEFDAKFWEKTEPKLEKFYTEAVIPYLERKDPVWAPEE
ncbi:uncharacterized protein LOC115082225 [Rhinatrema bivittatum]|uniref:uncharacterized protein LOC115082225 n=1 Tax=Rhinatrema bivittatum TaxID=194408 RepID=UPI0011266DF4|nr:uncharacterized protein LOC115082225 [Rhinatrema bivittatum]